MKKESKDIYFNIFIALSISLYFGTGFYFAFAFMTGNQILSYALSNIASCLTAIFIYLILDKNDKFTKIINNSSKSDKIKMYNILEDYLY